MVAQVRLASRLVDIVREQWGLDHHLARALREGAHEPMITVVKKKERRRDLSYPGKSLFLS